jgi:alcohol dehydrogenase
MGILLPSLLAALAGALVYRLPALLPSSVDPWHAKKDSETRMLAAVSTDRTVRLDSSFPQPILKPNQVLIKMTAAAINPIDVKLQRNWVPRFVVPVPKIPGADVSGVIERVGDAVDDVWKPGDRVVAMIPLLCSPWGSLAEYVAVDASLLAKVGTDLVAAASFPLVALTVVQAFQALGSTTDLRGKKILIQAGAGGVGTFAIQYAKHLGMYVATTASASKVDLVQSLGADQVIDYRTVKFEDVIEDFDVVLDPMSWAYEKRTLQSHVLKPTGHYLGIMSSDMKWEGKERHNAPSQAFHFIKHKLWNWIRPGYLPNYSVVAVSPNGKQLQDVMDLVSKGFIRPVIDRQFSLADAADAFDYLERGHASGKVILIR